MSKQPALLKKIDTAISESKRFIQRAEAWKCRIELDEYESSWGSIERGATKRLSLYLERALADLIDDYEI